MGVTISVQAGGAEDKDLTGAPEIEVHERLGEPTTYRLRFAVDIESGTIPWLTDSRIDPGTELAIIATADDDRQCLVKGPIHGQQMRLVGGGSGSWLDVLGTDATIAMDREVKATIWDKVTASDVAQRIAGTYGFTPDVDSTTGTFDADKHALVQRDTDFRFLRRIARRTGHLVWATSDPAGATTTLHVKRPPVSGQAVTTLTLRTPSPTVKALDLSFDTERPTSSVGKQVDLNTKQVNDGATTKSPLAALGTSDLASIATGTRTVVVAPPADTAGELTARNEGALIEAGWFVRATAEMNTETLGTVVRCHTLVAIDGAGKRHDGKYLVAGVRHLISQTAHRMQVELWRNGWGAS